MATQAVMSGGVAALVLLGLCFSGAQAQQPLPPQVHLTVTVEQAQLMVETLGQIGCQNVQQMILCQRAADLLRELQRQVRDQQK